VIEGQMTLGQLVAAELIVTVILGSFAKIGKDLESFYDLMASVDKLGKLFDLPVEPVNKLQLAKRPGAYGLTMVDTKLTSGQQSGYHIEFKPGKTFSVFGGPELSRANLVEILVGQKKPATGHVLLDEFRVDAISSESLQEKISLIRDVEIFEGTIDQNLRMGRENVGSAQINEIVGQLGLRKTLADLPDGFNTRLSINGYPLPRGQAVRLMLARGLISKPGVLLIEGLLDQLADSDIEDVLGMLNSFKSETTIVVTTGRRSIAQWADLTLDVENGKSKLEKFNG
jgi:putative ABC transport system ATP-binding protein